MKSLIAIPFADANCLFIFLQNLVSVFESKPEFWNSEPAKTVDELSTILNDSNQKHLNVVCNGDFSKWDTTPQFANIPEETAVKISEHFLQALSEPVTANYSWRDTAIECTQKLNQFIIDQNRKML